MLLCRLTKLEKARQVSWDAKQLQDTFLLKGYYEPKGSFICSTDVARYPSLEVTNEITNQWDPLWVDINEEFEGKITDSNWKDLSQKMLYTWDGNHQLTAWMGVLEKCELCIYL